MMADIYHFVETMLPPTYLAEEERKLTLNTQPGKYQSISFFYPLQPEAIRLALPILIRPTPEEHLLSSRRYTLQRRSLPVVD